MKYLIISSYPPMRCGIGKYAYQMVKQLQDQGNVVNVISPDEGNGDFTTNFEGRFNLLRTFKYVPFYDRLIINYHWSFFYDDENLLKNAESVIATHLAFIAMFFFFGRKVEVILHEVKPPLRRENRLYLLNIVRVLELLIKRNRNSQDESLSLHSAKSAIWLNVLSMFNPFLDNLKWRICPKIIFHTARELDEFQSIYFKIPSGKYEIRPPHKYYYKFRDISKKDARKELNLPLDGLIFLCIGFIQPHKGFDRAIKAFKNVNSERVSLYVVGSLRVNWGNYVSHLQHLKDMASQTTNIHIIERYTSDEEFDTWISASDVIVVPYREIWSSGVIARANLFGKPVIASNVGGLEDQIGPRDILFENDAELEHIFCSIGEMLGHGRRIEEIHARR